MTLWLILGTMTVAAILAVLVPLARRPAMTAAGDVEVYRDQLDEVARDRDRGTIGGDEAEAARIEIARRLIAATERAALPAKSAGRATSRRRMVSVVALVFVPLAAATIYMIVGRPDLPDQPLEARIAASRDAQAEVEDLVGRVETELKRNPQDGRGWDVIAPVYLRSGRPDDAVTAFRNAIRIQGSSAARQAGLGEALTLVAEGQVTRQAQEAFRAALALDPALPRPRYYLGRAAEQAGDPAAAAEFYRALVSDAPQDAPWRPLVLQALAGTALGAEGAMPEVDPSALANLTPDERFATIRGMAMGLEERLKEAPGDLGGRLRLIRAWTVLGDRARAVAAAQEGRAALAGDAAAIRRIDDLVIALGLEEKPPA